ncbi:hypothetical protein AB832_05125 [Flavobacteriaceae bacterium (ex Bugula neritina AB1)]|nr:hypothetical protein AB832_05125 [Flavobacteriaceae bacterium (ex Bugula neritina AB1)]
MDSRSIIERYKENKDNELHPVSYWIRNRKSTYAYDFIDEKIPKSLIEEIVTNGLWAPTHKMTQPWRFEVLQGKHKEDFGAYMLDYYIKHLTKEKFPESRYQETLEYPKNATLLAVIFQRNERARIPEWEEIAAISCAVQNIWITCSVMGLGGYWDTAPATIKYCKENIELKENEESLGIFYLGVPKLIDANQNRKRKPISKKLSWNTKL